MCWYESKQVLTADDEMKQVWTCEEQKMNSTFRIDNKMGALWGLKINGL